MTAPTSSSGEGWDFDELVEEFRPRRKTERICVDGALMDEIDLLEASLAEVRSDDDRLNRKAEAPTVARRILDLHDQAKARERSFTFQAIGQRPWSTLLGEHPPTKEQRRELGYDHDPESFPPVAIAASAVNPKMTVDQAQWLADNLNLGQFRKLWNAVLEVNVSGVDLGKGASAIARALAGVPSSDTAPPEESLTASS